MLLALRSLPPMARGAVPAQLSFLPGECSAADVARVVQVLPAVLPVGEFPFSWPPSTRVVHVRDLLVTADHHGMYLLDGSRDEIVEPVVANALTGRVMPPLVRFLAEVWRTSATVARQFDWGAAEGLPFLPRLLRGRCRISAARWRLHPGVLPEGVASHEHWRDSLQREQHRLGFPEVIEVGTRDRRLRLDLRARMDRDLLRDPLIRAGRSVTLVEAPSAFDLGWCNGRAHELVVPLVSATGPTATSLRAGRGVRVGRNGGLLPGSRVVSARIACAPEAIDAVIAEHLPVLLDDLDAHRRWWFVRVSSPRPQLRLRLVDERFGHGAERLGLWVSELRRRGLVGDLLLDTYRPEVARYTEHGDESTMAAAEAVFVADSAAARAQILAASAPAESEVLTAAGMFDLLSALTGGPIAAARWLLRRDDLASADPLRDRSHTAAVAELCGSSGGAALPESVGRAWRGRSRTAVRYRRALDERTHTTAPPVAPRDTIVVSLLHLHHVRAIGPDTEREARLFKLARTAALAMLARTPAGTVHP